MALKDQPYFPLYVHDIMADEKLIECSAETHGVYLRLLCLLHKEEDYGSIKLKAKYKQTESKIEAFACLLERRMPFSFDEINRSLSELIEYDVIQFNGEKLSQKRMVKDGDVSVKRARAGAIGGQSSKQKPSKEETKSEQNTVNADANEIKNETAFAEYLEENSITMKLARYATKSIVANHPHLRGKIDNVTSLQKTAVVLWRFMSNENSPRSNMAIREAIDYACMDDFWKSKFLDPQMLERENKDGIKHLDFFLAQIGYREPNKQSVEVKEPPPKMSEDETKAMIAEMQKEHGLAGKFQSIDEILRAIQVKAKT